MTILRTVRHFFVVLLVLLFSSLVFGGEASVSQQRAHTGGAPAQTEGQGVTSQPPENDAPETHPGIVPDTPKQSSDQSQVVGESAKELNAMDMLKSITTISSEAIQSSQRDVELVKWAFVAFTAFSGLLGFLGYRQLSDIKEMKQYYKNEAERNSQALTEMLKALGRMLTLQSLIDPVRAELLAKEKERRTLFNTQHRSDDQEKELRSLDEHCENLFEDIQRDLKEIQELSLKVDHPRWEAWIEGIYGVSLHLRGRYFEAIERLDRACDLARSLFGEAKDSEPLSSHLYNKACALAMMHTKDDEALAVLEESLKLTPWCWLEARRDPDFERLRKDDPRFNHLIERYQPVVRKSNQ